MSSFSCFRNFREYRKRNKEREESVFSLIPKRILLDVDLDTENVFQELLLRKNVTDLFCAVDATMKPLNPKLMVSSTSSKNDREIVKISSTSDVDMCTETVKGNVPDLATSKPNNECIATSISESKTVASMSNFSGSRWKRYIYDGGNEGERRKKAAVIKDRQKSLRDLMLRSKYPKNAKRKKEYLFKATMIQRSIDALCDQVEELGKMPNCEKKVHKEKEKKKKGIKRNFNLLSHYLTGHLDTKSRLGIDIHGFLISVNCLRESRKIRLRKAESAKERMNLALRFFNEYASSYRTEIFSSDSFQNTNTISTAEDLFSHCESLEKAVASNFNCLSKIVPLISRMMMTVSDYKYHEQEVLKLNSFFLNKNQDFFIIRDLESERKSRKTSFSCFQSFREYLKRDRNCEESVFSDSTPSRQFSTPKKKILWTSYFDLETEDINQALPLSENRTDLFSAVDATMTPIHPELLASSSSSNDEDSILNLLHLVKDDF